MKRISAILLALLIILSVSMPITVHADDGWENINKDTFIASLKAYAKANYNINTTFAYIGYDDPITQAIVSFSYSQFNRIANTLGYNLDDIQASIKARVDSNGALQFLYSGSYVQYYNALIRQYMIDNGINPELSNINKEIYNGMIFTDNDGYSTYVFQADSSSVLNVDEETFKTRVPSIGSAYKLYGKAAFNTLSSGYHEYSINGIPYYIQKVIDTEYNYDREAIVVKSAQYNSISASDSIYYKYNTYQPIDGYVALIYATNNNALYLGNYVKLYDNNKIRYWLTGKITIQTHDSENLINALVNIARDGMPQYPTAEDGKNAIIEAGKLGGDVAQQALKYLEDQEDKDVKQDPDYQGGTPNYPNPSNPDISNNTGLSLGGQPFHFEMPDLSGFNWEISGLQDKFPFSIPFDMIDFFTVLDASPQTPEFQVNVDIANVHVNKTISLSVFDDYMPLFRNIILAGWCIFLIVATRSVFKVY